MKKLRYIFATAGIVLVLVGFLILFPVVSSSLQVKSESLISGNAFQADFLPDAPTIKQGSSVAFSITNIRPFNNYDSIDQIGSCVWKIDNVIVSSSDATTFVYTGTTIGVHTVEVDLNFMYDGFANSETIIGYTTVTVVASSPTPTSTSHPTITPTPNPYATPTSTPNPHATPTPTPNPYATPTPTSWFPPIIPPPKNPTDYTLTILLGALAEFAGAFFLLLAAKRF